MQPFDVIVGGKGNAAPCAALAARDETGARVVMLEAAPVDESGGNSRFAGGMMRFVYNSVEDLKLLADIPDEEVKNTDTAKRYSSSRSSSHGRCSTRKSSTCCGRNITARS